MSPSLKKTAGIGFGALVITVGGGTAVLKAFEGAFLWTYGGIIAFILGYKISFYTSKPGKRRKRLNDLHSYLSGSMEGEWRWLRKQIMNLSIGGLGISAGVYLFVRTIIQPDLSTATLAGLISFTGYIVAHRKMNNSVM